MEIKEINLEDKRLKGFENVKNIIQSNGWDAYSFKDMEEYKKQMGANIDQKEKYTLHTLNVGDKNVYNWYDTYVINIIEIGDVLYVETMDLNDIEYDGEMITRKKALRIALAPNNDNYINLTESTHNAFVASEEEFTPEQVFREVEDKINNMDDEELGNFINGKGW